MSTYLENTILEHIQMEKDLGVNIDNKLKSYSHIGMKINQASSILGTIRSFDYLA